MKKNIFLRIPVGFVIGAGICYLITIGISLGIGNGEYYAAAPALVQQMGSVMGAVVKQMVLSGLLGAGFSVCALIWEKENWSLVKQSGIYFLCISSLMMPVAYSLYWMDRSLWGMFQYFMIFFLIFLLIWIVNYISGRKNVTKFNRNLKKHQ